MTQDRLETARAFVLSNARLLERQRFVWLFEGGEAAGVVRALEAYRNTDGGFGNALEPDKRVPASQPQDVEFAFHLLDEVGAMRGDRVMPALDWLTTVTTEEGGVPFTLQSAAEYPHAPWWGQASGKAELNPTAAILGLVLKHGGRHPWVEAATAFCWSAIEASDGASFHEVACSSLFLQHAPDRERAGRELGRIAERLQAPGAVALDPAATGYVQGPLEFAPTPDHPFRPLFDDGVIEAHLDALAARQQDDGGWPIKWDPISEGVRLEWRGKVTVDALVTLRAYGRL